MCNYAEHVLLCDHIGLHVKVKTIRLIYFDVSLKFISNIPIIHSIAQAGHGQSTQARCTVTCLPETEFGGG